MTVEQRLIDALHRVDEYEPSIDLYARTTRSIEEDRAHRRRVITSALWTLFGLVAVAAFLYGAASRNAGGQVVFPKWSLVLAQLMIVVPVLLVLGPLIRRFGQPLIQGAFHVNPETGARFSRVLDIAYYLFFGGLIVLAAGIDRADFATMVSVSELRDPYLDQLAGFFLVLGITHALNLLVIPVVGLIFSAGNRRARRHLAGQTRPAESPRALQADRVATWISYAVAAWIILQLAGLVLSLVAGVAP